MEALNENLAVLLPLILLEAGLALIALVHVLRHKNYKHGNRLVWVFIVLFLQFIGPVLYFVLGKGEEE